MKCLYSYYIPDFLDYIENDLKISNWKIMLDTIENRYEYISNSKYVSKLEDMGYELDFFEDDYDNYEVIAWIDSASILYKTFNLINPKKYKDIYIIAEYSIPKTNNRCDFLLIKNNKIMILEFTNSLHENKQKYRKQQQVNNYKNLINKQINNPNIIIKTKVVKYDQEYGIEENPYDTYDSKYIDYKNYNEELIDKLSDEILDFFYETNNIQAINYLNNNSTDNYIQDLLNQIEELKDIIKEKDSIINKLKNNNPNSNNIIYKRYYKGIIKAIYNGYEISLHSYENYHNHKVEIIKIFNDGNISIEFQNGNQKTIRIFDLDCFN
ncbi:MAG: hypothetical protein NC310_01950 [Roseburia sp.]|nr:hypothetical protein [Roseburia sp.]MCM1556287.1 hypothetical protein [Anaeroplasma bactoclasticum]